MSKLSSSNSTKNEGSKKVDADLLGKNGDSDQLSASELSDSQVGNEDPGSGLETENDDPTIKILKPFDPEKIKVRTTSIVVDLLVSRIEHKEIDLAPDFQRSFVWSTEHQSRLIESLLLRIPIPVFYVAADKEENWSVVDGVQRMTTIFNYVKGEFRLSRLEYLHPLDGLVYKDLPRAMQRRIKETQLVVNVIEPGTPEDVMFNIFSRINTGGMTLKGQEIRNALHPGPVRKYLNELANSDEFLKATDHSIRKKRMDDHECVLRFLAFFITPWEQYSTYDLDGYLGHTMAEINKMSSESRAEYASEFRKAMQAAHGIFGDDSFRKRYNRAESRFPISRALFEVWSVQLARCSNGEIEKLVKSRDVVVDRFINVMNHDTSFEKSISLATGSPQNVKARFSTIERLVEEVVGNANEN